MMIQTPAPKAAVIEIGEVRLGPVPSPPEFFKRLCAHPRLKPVSGFDIRC